MIQSLKELNSSSCVDFSTKMTDASYTGFINEWNEFYLFCIYAVKEWLKIYSYLGLFS
jgi:hypothetical protein